MKTTKMKLLTKLILLSFIVSLLTLGWRSDVQNGGGKRLYKPTEVGEFTVFNINNVRIPLDNKGIIADVDPGDGIGSGGTFANIVFLFSGGFFLSGEDGNTLWGNGVMSASRIEDYQPGPVGSNQNDSKNKVYVVRVQDRAFGDSWQEWRDAVSIGADFYDGDGDGVYNPVDLNSNGSWDPNEDRPDLIGDWTAWCVFNDGIPAALKRFTAVPPKGIEIHQTVFGFASKGVVGNMMFVRYRIINKGTVNNVFNNVYFSAVVDPDLGDPNDDLVGCDTTLSAGFVYNDGDDPTYGAAPPAFLMDFFQGPIVYKLGYSFTDVDGDGVYTDGVDTPLKTAYNVGGRIKGIKEYKGAYNLPLTSFTQYMQSHPTHGDPNTHLELRNYMIGGKGKNGDSLYVSKWTFGNGSTLGADTAKIPARFMYSGDPYTRKGWLNTSPIDQRQMSNTGPFTLEKDKPVDIYVVYVLGRGDNATHSVFVAKQYDQIAQLVFDNNFPSPPPPPVINYTVTTGDGFIDVDFETAPFVKYREIDNVLDIDRKFQGFYVNMYKTNVKATSIGSVKNEAEVAHFSLNNMVKDIYVKESNGGINLVRKRSETLLDSLTYADPTRGRIKVRITEDPFTGRPLVKGTPYYIVIGNYTLNHRVIVNKATGTYGKEGDYLDPTNGALEEFETGIIKVEYGKDMYNPVVTGDDGVKLSGASDGAVSYLVVDKTKLTGDKYAVEFFKDKSVEATEHSMFYRLINKTQNKVLLDSSKYYNFDMTDYSGKVYDGFVLKVKPNSVQLKTQAAYQQGYKPAANKWFTDFAQSFFTGVYYVGSDLPNAENVKHPSWPAAVSKVIKVDDLRRVELRFGAEGVGKAYRYMNGFVGANPLQRKGSWVYAGGVTAADTAGRGGIGKFGQGFVDVPFTAWIVDERFGEQKQLAVGFIERSVPEKGNPDGIWDPGTNVSDSREVIVIFNMPYDPTGNQKVLTGGDFNGTPVWADIIKGFKVPAGTLSPADSSIANTPWFNAMYVVSLQRKDNDPNSWFKIGDVLNIELAKYPYSSRDVFEFNTNAGGLLTKDQQQGIFDKVNVYPNPLFAYNIATSYDVTKNPDDPFVTFTNLPEKVTVKIYSLSGSLLRTLTEVDKQSGVSSPFLQWDLKNEKGLRVASGMYLAIVSSPEFGEKILKFAIIQPQKQLKKY
jgi:hypothetical protein